MHGHSMLEIDTLSYWDFVSLSNYNSAKNNVQSGKTTYKQLNKTQKSMIAERKKREGTQ